MKFEPERDFSAIVTATMPYLSGFLCFLRDKFLKSYLFITYKMYFVCRIAFGGGKGGAKCEPGSYVLQTSRFCVEIGGLKNLGKMSILTSVMSSQEISITNKSVKKKYGEKKQLRRMPSRKSQFRVQKIRGKIFFLGQKKEGWCLKKFFYA